MAFTYSDGLLTDRDRIRFFIGDTVSAAGTLPGGTNFTDAELTGLLAIEGTWQRTVAAALDKLVGAWAQSTVSWSADGVSVTGSNVAGKYATRLADWRRLYGINGSPSVGSRPTTRADGYSDDLDNVTV